MPKFSAYRIGEREGGVTLQCPDCDDPVAYVGGDTIATLKKRAALHNADKHADEDDDA